MHFNGSKARPRRGLDPVQQGPVGPQKAEIG
jgi:hypothetical protein